MMLAVFLISFTTSLFFQTKSSRNLANRQVKQAVRSFQETSTNLQLTQSVNAARRLGRLNLMAVCTVLATGLLVGFAIVYHRYRRIALARRKSFAYWMFTGLAVIGGLMLVVANSRPDVEPHPADKWLKSGRDLVLICAIFGIIALVIQAKQTSLPYESKLDAASAMASVLSKAGAKKPEKEKGNKEGEPLVQTAKLQVIREERE